ncbi:helix-turn-helix domain-containing protein [Levilactobacillus lanxiensis]|uniref:Helix-turn-helix domain-containing protein n=1 Tax=Levilactobacillus lanxiensis TaxID=2799568 RepID=A0ABW4D4Y1_9LACO|nr:helix-turn-helix transcriptional regulator [Levilactobacillus lanxiensis]
MTTKIDNYIAKRSAEDPIFATAVNQESLNLDVAVAVTRLRAEQKMSQREFARLVGKPQSTIARIEEGKMNVSVRLLQEIAIAANKELSIQFI